MKRSLTLNRESLSELSFDDLGLVVGGAVGPTGWTCPPLECVNSRYIPCTV